MVSVAVQVVPKEPRRIACRRPQWHGMKTGYNLTIANSSQLNALSYGFVFCGVCDDNITIPKTVIRQ